MRVMIDNNIAIDALRPNPEFESAAKQIFRLIWQDKIEPFMYANSLTDIFYVMQKAAGAKKAKEIISNLMAAVSIVPLTAEDCANALSLSMNDFEDAVIAVCAKKAKADFIVTRDEKFINEDTAVLTVTPQQLIEKVR